MGHVLGLVSEHMFGLQMREFWGLVMEGEFWRSLMEGKCWISPMKEEFCRSLY
jgi:hypothetical protein